jgi:hypothetical protein
MNCARALAGVVAVVALAGCASAPTAPVARRQPTPTASTCTNPTDLSCPASMPTPAATPTPCPTSGNAYLPPACAWPAIDARALAECQAAGGSWSPPASPAPGYQMQCALTHVGSRTGQLDTGTMSYSAWGDVEAQPAYSDSADCATSGAYGGDWDAAAQICWAS